MIENKEMPVVVENIIKDIKPIPMKIEDIPQISEIFISYWGTMCLYEEITFVRIISQNLSYVYKIGDKIIAFCLMEYNYEDDIVEIVLFCVRKEYKGQHLGKSLLSFCIKNCHEFGFNTLSLHVSTNNTPAFNLYKKAGFKIRDFIPKYYSDEKPEDSNAYFMVLNM